MRYNRPRRDNFRNNDRGFRRNGSRDSKINSINHVSNSLHRRPFNRNDNNPEKLLEKYNTLAKEASSKGDKTLSEMLAELPKYYSTPELRLEVENDEEKFRIANEAIEYFKANYDCSTVDGVRIRFGDGWGLVRSSNTQPVIVCRFEANSQERMEEIQALVMGKLQEFGTLKLDAGH